MLLWRNTPSPCILLHYVEMRKVVSELSKSHPFLAEDVLSLFDNIYNSKV